LTLTVGALQVSADTTTITISNPNSAISGFAGPYASVLVNRTSSTTATVTFTSLTNSGNIYLMGDGGTADLNINATAFGVTGVTGSNAGTGFTPGPYTVANPPGTQNVDGFGLFNLDITSFDGFTHSSDTVSFTVTNTSGTWSSATNVLTPNSGGSDAAIHVFVTSSPANASNGALATGFAANGAQVPAPEPASMLLFGTGLVALGTKLRRRKSGNPAVA
jgi:hypothetical protein